MPASFERARGGREAYAGGNDDHLEVRERLHQRQGLLLVDLLAFLAISNLHQLHLGEFRLGSHLRLHEVDPGILVGRRGRRREDCEFAFAAAEIECAFEHHFREAVALHLVDEYRPCIGRDVRVIRDYPDALLHRTLQRRGNGIGVVAEIAMTPTFCDTRLLMNSICASAVAWDGATCVAVPPISFAASSAPPKATLK
jgi:hypothetical protein